MNKLSKSINSRYLWAITVVLIGSVVTSRAENEQLVSRPLSYQDMADYELPEGSQRSGGFWNVGVGMPVYLEVQVPKGTTIITGTVWSLTGQPAGSTAELAESPLGVDVPIYNLGEREDNEVVGRNLLVPDMIGTYSVEVSFTTDAGLVTLTKNITGATYVGVGTIDGATPQIPQCGVCHPDNAAGWAGTKHSTKLARDLNGQTSPFFQESCIECHSVGYDPALLAVNGGFDDVQVDVGWTFPETLTEGNWEAMPDALKAVSNIQCENCHGPGSEHKGDISKITVSLSAGDCGQCHDEVPYHSKVEEWEKSAHAISTRYPTGEGRETCVVCHSGGGFIERVDKEINIAVEPNYPTKITDTTWEPIVCGTCHDPHDATNVHQLRRVDDVTLFNGVVVTEGGAGKVCMNCHISRRDAETYVQEYHDHFGPHYGPQTDMLAGTNAIDFGREIRRSTHLYAVEDACATCHIQEISRDDPLFTLAGGHTFSPSWDGGTPDDDSDDVDLTGPCISCHGPLESFDRKREDYDSDGFVDGIQTEVKSLMDLLARELPPIGEPDFAVTEEFTLVERQAAYNYLFVEEDSSFGIHNAAYTVGILKAAIEELRGERMDPFGGVSFADLGLPNWFESPWFGLYMAAQDSWIFSEYHGYLWLYQESTSDTLYLWDPTMESWWYTTAAVYPNIYMYNGSGWGWYFVKPGNTRTFYRYSDGEMLIYGR